MHITVEDLRPTVHVVAVTSYTTTYPCMYVHLLYIHMYQHASLSDFPFAISTYAAVERT